MNYWGGASIPESGELFAMDFAKSKLGKEEQPLIFDVGANSGEFAVHAARIFGAKAEIHSFEPSGFTFNRLVQTIEKEGLGNTVIPHHIGFGDKKEKVTLYFPGKGASVASIYGSGQDLTEEISLTTIDRFCHEENIAGIDYLKLDIEGHEYFALLGAGGLLREKKIRFIQFEFGENHLISRCYFKDFYELLGKDYSLYRIVPNGLRPIKGYSTDLEIFSTINYLAELKQ
jgi:FkbM family methyltransferase